MTVALFAASAGVGSASGADAATTDSSHKTSAVTVDKWGADLAATTVSSTPVCPTSCGPFTGTGLGPWDFNMWNTGTATLSGVSYVVSFTGGISPSATLTACSVAWVATLCSGTSTLVLSAVSAGTFAVTAAIPSAPGSKVFLQAVALGAPTNITFSTKVSSAGPRQIAAAVTTNA